MFEAGPVLGMGEQRVGGYTEINWSNQYFRDGYRLLGEKDLQANARKMLCKFRDGDVGAHP